MEVPGGVGFGCEDVRAVLWRQVGGGGVVQDGRAVHDSLQGVLFGDFGEQGRELVAVAHVAGSDVDFCAECGQFLDQVVDAGCVGASTAGEQQAAHAVFGDEVAGGEGAEAGGAAGDQHGAVGGRVRGRRVRPLRW
nr:hypothetical protein [Saccharothrix sp. NRRL B-16314]